MDGTFQTASTGQFRPVAHMVAPDRYRWLCQNTQSISFYIVLGKQRGSAEDKRRVSSRISG
jgi:hypothetical protein